MENKAPATLTTLPLSAQDAAGNAHGNGNGQPQHVPRQLSAFRVPLRRPATPEASEAANTGTPAAGPPAVAGPPPPAEAATTVTDAGTAAAGPAAAAASTAEAGIAEAEAATQRVAPAKKRRADKSPADPTKARLAPTALAAKALSTKAEPGSALTCAGRYPPKDPIRRARFLVERQMWHDWRKDLNVYTSEDNQESYWAFLRAHIALDSENYDEKIDHCIALWQGNSTRESHLRAAF